MIGRLQAFVRQRLAGEEEADPSHGRRVAAAALLIEVARADEAYDASEATAIRSALSTALSLEPAELDELIALAEQETEAATSLHQFTRLINDTLTIADKRSLMADLWRVAYADGRIDKFEEQLLRRIADLLHLRHAEFMQAKHAAAPSQ